MNSNLILTPTIPAFENGDRLSRKEFERLYHLIPHLKKAELIEGVVYVASPVRIKRHAEPHADIMIWLGTYKVATPGVKLADNATVRLDLDNEPQPDALLRLDEACGGQSRVDEDDYIEGAPELVVEVASSSASYDLHDKLQVYRRNGVQEYLVWIVPENQFRWHILTEGEYQQQPINASGILTSSVFPGLNLDVQALLKGEIQQVLNVLQEGLNLEEHQAFREKISSN